jgi:hypothetical protein
MFAQELGSAAMTESQFYAMCLITWRKADIGSLSLKSPMRGRINQMVKELNSRNPHQVYVVSKQ